MARQKQMTVRRLLLALKRIKREHGDQVPVEMQRYDDIRQACPLFTVHIRRDSKPEHKAQAVVLQ